MLVLEVVALASSMGISFRFPEKLVQAFRDKCAEENVSQAEVIRLMIQMYLGGKIIISKKLTMEIKPP